MAIALVIAQGIIQYGDTRWSLAAEAKETLQTMEQHIEEGLKTDILILTMKKNGASQEAIDAALLKQYEAQLKAMRDKQNGQD